MMDHQTHGHTHITQCMGGAERPFIEAKEKKRSCMKYLGIFALVVT